MVQCMLVICAFEPTVEQERLWRSPDPSCIAHRIAFSSHIACGGNAKARAMILYQAAAILTAGELFCATNGPAM